MLPTVSMSGRQSGAGRGGAAAVSEPVRINCMEPPGPVRLSTRGNEDQWL